jgi:Domain of unknown function (DUF6458)
MGIGVSLFLLAVGAVLTFAVNATVSGIEISTVGIILMIIGGVGLLISLMLVSTERRRATTTVVETPVIRRDTTI